HYDRLYRLARRLAPDADDAQDIVQETFLRAARSPRSIPAGARNEEAWLVRVLINIRRDQWRKDSVRLRHQETASHGARHEASGGHPEAGLVARAAVWQALDVLPPRRRAVVVMHELEELPVSNIASLLGISVITVRWHLSMGRRDLARALKTSGGNNHE
ncbi:MAG TPA: RNA polymerase sigma factor, partial [Terriglobia bacterium]|nr:RNA polymerase sigma factor [Terriglobia bacterium]